MSALLEVSELTVSFGALKALDDVSFEAQRGTITAVIGPNGAGKTTCLNVLSGLQPANGGAVRYRGDDVTTVPPHRRPYLGRTFQVVQPFGGLTVKDSVLVAAEASERIGLLKAALRLPGARDAERDIGARVASLLDRLGLGAVASTLVETLPLGLQRLVEFARALARDPELLLLDEAASGLSGGEMEGLLSHVLRCRDAGCTIVLIEHNMRFVSRLADHLVVLDRGSVLYDGDPVEGFRDPTVVAAYLGREGDAARV